MELARRLRAYVVTPEGGDHLRIARAACAGGAGTVQLRAPGLDPARRREVATEMVVMCRESGVLSIVNDDVEAARGSGADGVHLGQADRPRWGAGWHDVRAVTGGLVLGVSADDVAQAREAVAAGADYLGVTVHPTSTKHDARAVGVATLRDIVAAVDVPVVAIGGLHTGNAAEVLAAGAAGIAVISAVSSAPDPVAAVRELVAVVAGTR